MGKVGARRWETLLNMAGLAAVLCPCCVGYVLYPARVLAVAEPGLGPKELVTRLGELFPLLPPPHELAHPARTYSFVLQKELFMRDIVSSACPALPVSDSPHQAATWPPA